MLSRIPHVHPPLGWVERNGLRGAPWSDEVMAQWVEAVVLELRSGGNGREGKPFDNSVPMRRANAGSLKELQTTI